MRTRPAAQPQAVERAKAETDDHEVDRIFARHRHRFARLVGRDDVVIRAQRADNALRRASLLVHEQQSPSFRCVQFQGFGERDHSRSRAMRGPIAQFIDRKLEPNQRPNASNQRDFVDRLGQEVVGAEFETAHAIGRPVKRG